MNYTNIREVFEAFKGMKVLVVGDVMVDSYLWGHVDRISPEAPVPIVQVNKHESRPGGAANVAKNIQALGATPILVAVTGNDQAGEQFIALLKEHRLPHHGIVRSERRKTTIKTRVIGNQHQLIRVDEEVTDDLDTIDSDLIIQQFTTLIDSENPDVVILEDYDKGVLCKKVIDAIIKISRSKNIPITVDPKKKNFNSYVGVDLFKPNLLELKEGLKIDIDKNDHHSIETAARSLLQERDNKMVMITLSEAGVFIADKTKSHLIPAHIRDISDVSGAGDTVISVASLALAAQLPMKIIAEMSNLAGGLVCEVVGVAPIDKGLLQSECEQLSLLTTELKNS